MTKLKVFTLNVWGIPTPVVCKFRRERVVAIGDELAKGEYDIVLLQEVWLKSDYQILVDKLSPAMPYTHYFYSGMIGSGVCVFSKGPISDVQLFRFHLNGFAHKVHHGDWFGGKGLGMCKIEYKGLHINVYSAHVHHGDWFGGKGLGMCQIEYKGLHVNVYSGHLHAEYNRDNDSYISHRIAQSFELSQVIKLTSGSNCDLVILGGDLNHEPVDLGYKLVCANAGLSDAWIEKVSSESAGHAKTCECECPTNRLMWPRVRCTTFSPVSSEKAGHGNTCECPTNSFALPSLLKRYPHGKRIDYILYKAGSNKSVICEECYTPFSKIPTQSYNYSDHEPLTAIFDITTAAEPNLVNIQDKANLSSLLTEASSVIDGGLVQTGRMRTLYLTAFLVCLALVWFTAIIPLPSQLDPVLALTRAALVIIAFLSLWGVIVASKAEENAHKEIRTSMETLVGKLNQEGKKFL